MVVGRKQGIFVPYFGYVWGDMQADLACLSRTGPAGKATTGTGATKEQKKKGSSKKRGREEDEGQEEGSGQGLAVGEKGSEVAALVLSALTQCFQCQDEAGLAATEGAGAGAEEGEGEGEGFLTQARFEGIMPYVAGLIAGLRRLLAADSESESECEPDAEAQAKAEAEAAYLVLAEEKLVPCLSQMAAAVGKDVLWKPLHHAVLMRTRDGDWAVRATALRVLHATFAAVGEEYLAMLPESISYLSELLEDERAEVVALCRKTIAYIEDLSGESLESYLA